MEIEVIYSDGKFYCQEKPEMVKNYLLNDDVLNVDMTCNSPFEGTAEELSALAVEFLNGEYKVNWRFNIILNSNTEEHNVIRNVGFQMCREGF
jgi:hypothetical protein